MLYIYTSNDFFCAKFIVVHLHFMCKFFNRSKNELGFHVPYAHLKEVEEICSTFQDANIHIDLMGMKLFPLTSKT